MDEGHLLGGELLVREVSLFGGKNRSSECGEECE